MHNAEGAPARAASLRLSDLHQRLDAVLLGLNGTGLQAAVIALFIIPAVLAGRVGYSL